MRPFYKKIEGVGQFCPLCAKQLAYSYRRDCSWRCDCAHWRFNIETKEYDLMPITEDKEHEKA